MRPSKLRLPDSTDTAARSCALHGRRDLARQRPGVADARRAAVADEVEAERLEVVGQAGAWSRYSVTTFEPGASDVLTHGFARQAARDGVARQQARGEHHRRVGGVRAARDRGDHDVRRGRARSACRRRASTSTVVSTRCGDGRRVLVASSWCTGGRRGGLVRRRRVGRRERQRRELDRRLLVVVARRRAAGSPRRRSGTRPARALSATRSCGRLGPASDGTTSPRSSSIVSE